MATLKLEHIYKVYDGRVKAVNDLNLVINDKDFIVFVGPSGCGKSTTLRMIAGLEEITSGKLMIDDVLVNELAPKDRDIAMVFQNYALYPHKTVYDNMAFGLKLAGLKDEEIKKRIHEASEILELTPYLTRKPKALSGGQKQRVALGRSIVREPKVFLLDEPLSNLDAKLRVQMRSEITKLHRRLGTTFIYVTHDQVEAMTMGSRIVVMKDGFIQQIDSPTNLYDHPDNVFVATFLGTPQMNMFKGTIRESADGYYLVIDEHETLAFQLSASIVSKLISSAYLTKKIIFGVRPEDVYEVEENSSNSFNMIVEIQEKRGSELIVYGVIENSKLNVTAKLDGRRIVQEGDKITLRFSEERFHLFDLESEQRIAEVITYDYLPGHLYPLQQSLKVANQSLQLSTDVFDSILPEYKIKDTQIGLKIATDAFHLQRQHESDLNIKATIKSVEQDKVNALVFVELQKEDYYICAKIPPGNYQIGTTIDLFIDTAKIELFDEDYHVKITALHPITSNVTTCEIKTIKGHSVAHFGGFKLRLDELFEPGQYTLKIPYDAFEIVKDKKMIIQGRNMRFKCVNESAQGAHTILYANLKEFPDYLSIKAGKEDTCFTKGKIIFNINKVIISQL